MELYKKLEALANALIKPLDLRLQRISRIQSIETGQHIAQLSENAKIIGSIGATEAFIQYANKGIGESEHQVNDFMRFYADYYQLSRSQWSQDIYAMYATKMLRHGTYLEVGGADGITHSNTLALRNELGWSGVLVEPDPSMFHLLKASRGHSDRIINAAVSPNGGQGNAELRRAGQLSSLVGHEGEDLHERKRKQHNDIVNVTTIDLTDLMAGMRRLDYFSLDVEGAETSIIESIKWHQIEPPLLITVEHNYREEEKKRLKGLLEAQGYVEQFAGHEWLRRGDLWLQHKDCIFNETN